MEIKVKNVGLLKDVSIDLSGLTVIAGENDTGKSTLGKAIFVVQKSYMMSRGGFFYKNWRRYIDHKIRNFKIEMSGFLNTRQVYDRIANILNTFQAEAESILLDRRLNEHDKRRELKKKINELNLKLSNYHNVPYNTFISQLMVSTSPGFKDIFRKRNLARLLKYQFYGDELSKLFPDEESFIEIKSLTGRIKAVINGLDVRKFEIDGTEIIRDVTFIDTPVIFQLINLLSEEEVIPKEYTPTIKDLRRKIKDQTAFLLPWEEEEAEKIIANIRDVITADVQQFRDGNFHMMRDLCGKNLDIRLENAATGIKSFSLLLILIQKGWIRSNTLLIVDEPEVHLHPIWQVKYARLLIELVKKGVYVLVTSHSPYLVQAIEKFSRDEGLSERTRFYLSNKENCGKVSVFKDVSSSINEIYRLFVLPVREILK